MVLLKSSFVTAGFATFTVQEIHNRKHTVKNIYLILRPLIHILATHNFRSQGIIFYVVFTRKTP